MAGAPWLRQHEYLEKISVQAHYNVIHRGDEFVMEALCDHDKLPVLVHELLAIEMWRLKVYPEISDSITEHSSLRAYTTMYHEASVCSLLECVLFHRSAVEAAGESLLEVVDYCMRKITWLVSRPRPSTKAKTTKDVIREVESDQGQLRMQADEVSFSCAMAALTIFRYLTDHAEVLHVSVASRMARHHDFVGVLVEVMEQAPWTRTERFVIPSTESAEGGGAKKKAKKKIRTKYSRFQNNAWSEIEQGDRTLCQAEAQVWLALHALILADPNSAMKYEFDDHKKETVQRLKKPVNPQKHLRPIPPSIQERVRVPQK